MLIQTLVSLVCTVAPPDSALAKPGAAVDQAKLVETIKALPLKRSGWKDAEHRAGLRQTEELIQQRLKALGYSPTLHEIGAFTGRGEKPADANGPTDTNGGDGGGERGGGEVWHNIIVDIPGKETPGEVLIVGAHFDAVPFCPAADDNGSGAAALLELARVLKDTPMRRTVRLAFFNLEETQPLGIGLIGSSAYASDLSSQLKDGSTSIIGMISMDTIGYFSDEPDSQTWPKLPIQMDLPTTADFILVGGLASHQKFSRPLIDAMRAGAPDLHVLAGDILPMPVPNFMRSDHASFLSMGIPAVMVTDTANFRSKHYHKPTDTIDTLDLPRYTMVVRAMAEAVYHIAGPVTDVATRPRRPAGEPRPEPKPVDPIPPTDPAPVVTPERPGLGPQPGRGPERPRR